MPTDREADRLDLAPSDVAQRDHARLSGHDVTVAGAGRVTPVIAWIKRHPWLTALGAATAVVSIICMPWLQTLLGWGSLSWGTYWTGIGAVGTTAALGFAAENLRRGRQEAQAAQEAEKGRRHDEDIRRARDRHAEQRRRDDERKKRQEARLRWATSLDRQERLSAYRDLLIAQDARLTLLAERLKAMETRDAGTSSPVAAAEALGRYDVDLDAARQRAWAAMATILLVFDADVVTAATDFNRAVNKEIKACQRARTFDEAQGATSALSGERGRTGSVFRDLTRGSLFDLPPVEIDDDLVSGRDVDDWLHL